MRRGNPPIYFWPQLRLDWSARALVLVAEHRSYCSSLRAMGTTLNTVRMMAGAPAVSGTGREGASSFQTNLNHGSSRITCRLSRDDLQVPSHLWSRSDRSSDHDPGADMLMEMGSFVRTGSLHGDALVSLCRAQMTPFPLACLRRDS